MSKWQENVLFFLLFVVCLILIAILISALFGKMPKREILIRSNCVESLNEHHRK